MLHTFSHKHIKGMLLVLCVLMASCVSAQKTNTTIQNDRFWHCTDGTPIYSQGGGIFRFLDADTGRQRYYWYGVRYREAEEYANDPSVTCEHPTFESVTCYVSDDLINWLPCGDVLSRQEIALHVTPHWVGRMGVAKVDSVYALFVQCGSKVLLAESLSPNGEFKWSRLIDMTDMISTSNTGDQTVFTDEDTGKSYLICSKGSGRNKIYVAEIGRLKDGSVGFTDCSLVFTGSGREGNCMFKHNGKYYLCASNLYGWDGSYAYFMVADDVKGPYRKVISDYQQPINDYPANSTNSMQVMPGCEKDYAHISQTGFFYTVRGESGELVIYCGDRWADFAGNGLGYNQWVPLTFNGVVPQFNSLSAWTMNAEKAIWDVAPDNNYILNGSFEADRRIIPLKSKPKQDFITGWKNEFIKGNVAKVEDETSPRLNYEKTREERRNTIGEKALLITDTKPFKRRVSQVVSSMGAITLGDGFYTLKSKMKVSEGFKELYIYTISNGKTTKKPVNITDDDNWQAIELKDVEVKGGIAEVGFYAEGKSHARCLVDDVEFCMSVNE